jgi:D-galactarolactone cycloisomerase
MPRIIAVETWVTRTPFDMGAKPVAFGGMGWQAMTTLWLRVATEGGLEGWGEGFGHACVPATRAVIDTQLAPVVLGQDSRDIAGLRRRLAQSFHLFGGNGPHVYAASALDIALWDIAGKAAGLPLWRVWGGAPTETLRAYASLLRYGAPDLVAAACERALARGHRDIKLHETELAPVRAARQAMGAEPRLMVDTNCPWSVAEARRMARALSDLDLTWLEEPVWPPEDYAGLARVRAEGVPIAAGENAAGLFAFRALFEAGALDVAQPSVTKIGGPSAMLEIAALARAFGVRLVPHNAYFGPGYLASLHVNATVAPDAPFEHIFVDLEASPLGEWVRPEQGLARVPQGPGLGFDPDMAVLRRCAIGEPMLQRT